MADEYEKHIGGKEAIEPHGSGSDIVDEEVGVVNKSGSLNRDLKNRHMQSKSLPGMTNASSFCIAMRVVRAPWGFLEAFRDRATLMLIRLVDLSLGQETSANICFLLVIAIGMISIYPFVSPSRCADMHSRWCHWCRSFRRIWRCPTKRRSSLSCDLLHDHRRHAAVHMPGTR